MLPTRDAPGLSFDDVPDAVIVTDDAGEVLAANAAARFVLGPRRVEGASVESLFHGVDAAAVLRALRSLVTGTATRSDLHVSIVGEAGSIPIWARAARTEATDASGGTVIWSLRETASLEVTHQELAAAAALKDAYLLALAHDLRTPVALLAASPISSRARSDDATAVEALSEVMRQGVHEIDQLLSDLLDVERLEHGGVDVDRRDADLVELVDRCVKQSQADRVEVDVLVPRATVDTALVERILVNLLVNARDHCGSGPVRVIVEPEPAGICLTVEDRGPGIPDAWKEAVFELFNQMRPGGLGLGVGMYLVRRFAVLHGGSACVVNAPEGGAAVRVHLATA